LITVLFACTHNAGRSQMAAAFFNALADAARVRGMSAGTEPAAAPHPEVVAAMLEAGLDLGSTKPQLLTSEMARAADVLVTMGCGDSCPVVPGLRTVEWKLDDPKGRPMKHVRRIRDEVRALVEGLVQELDAGRGRWP
jgi:arsenate reductase